MIPVSDRPYSETWNCSRRIRTRFAGRMMTGIDWETSKWLNSTRVNGGILESPCITIGDALIKAVKARSYGVKMVSLYPFFGTSQNAWAVPLLDRLSKGIIGVGNFLAADVTFSGGVQGNGTSKYFDTLTKPSELGASNSGGYGWWDLNAEGDVGTTYAVMGMGANNGTDYYVLRSHPSPYTDLIWGKTANAPNSATFATQVHWYAQRSSSTLREIYQNGALLVSNTTADATAGAGDRNIQLFGWDLSSGRQYYKGRCGVCYMTDGTLTATEVADLHYLLRDMFLLPTGRLSSI
jgi:hypothetical protein